MRTRCLFTFTIKDFRNFIRSNSQQQPSIQGAGARGPTASQQTATGVPRRASTRRANLFGRRRPIRQQDLPASRAATLTEKTAANVQNRYIITHKMKINYYRIKYSIV